MESLNMSLDIIFNYGIWEENILNKLEGCLMANQALTGCESWHGTQLRAKEPEDEGSRPTDSDADESQDAGTPTITQVVVHIWREEGKAKASQATQDSARGHSTGGVGLVTVDNIRLHAL